MKKLAVYASLLVTLFVVTACENRPSNPPPQNPSQRNMPQNPNQPPPGER